MFMRVSRVQRWYVVLLCALMMPHIAFAQTGPYINTSSHVINSSTSCGGNEFVRTINVPDSFIIGDVDYGTIISHTWRGDVPIDLTSPQNTTVRLVNPDTNNLSQNNYNIRLDDDAATLVNTAPHNTNDNTGVAPYQNLVRPNNSLSAFNGQNANGTWMITMCDAYPSADNGQFIRGELFFTAATNADLSLSVSASNTAPNTGTNVVLTYTLANAGPLDASGISVNISLPVGLNYVSDNSGGAFNSASGVWTVAGNLANNGSTSIQITAFVNTSGPYTTSGEVSASNQPDPDSTPANGNTGEDDYATITLSPVSPPVPSLLCPGAASVLDWDTQNWPTGSMNNSYTIDGETIQIVFSDPNNALQSDASFGGQTPSENTTLTGGYSPVQSNVAALANQPNRAGTVDITINLGTPSKGVSKFQLTIFDVDFGSNQFQDQITVNGYINGVAVTPSFITGSAHTASGNVVTGQSAAASNVGTGNLTIEFQTAVDQVVINYGSGPSAPANPGLQGIGMHDIFFCKATNAVLNAVKTTQVFDPTNAGLYAVPGNDVIYTIEFTNSGDGPADNDSILIIDGLPDEIEFYNGDIDGPGPQTTPVTGTDNGSGLTFNYASDVRYSNALSRPVNFAACSYTPSAGYDPNVNYICVNPKGTMAAGTPDPSFAIKFRARIK